MMNTLLVRLSTQRDHIDWSILSDERQKESGSVATLTELTERAQGCNVIAWLSAQQVSLMQSDVPAGQIRHLDKMLPALLEDRVAADIDQLHFAMGGKPVDDQVTIAVVSREIMHYWLNAFSSAGLQLKAMIPDSLALPWQQDGWTLSVEENLSYLRWSQQGGLVCDTANIATVLGLQLAVVGQPTSLQLYAEHKQQYWPADMVVSEFKGRASNILSQLPDTYAMAINLLQGDFRPQSDFQKQWMMWRPPVIIAAIALALQLVVVSVETWQLNQQAEQYRGEVETLFHQAFPDEKRIVNARVQMSQRLEELQKQNEDFGFLAMMQQIAPSFKNATGLSLARINFDRNRSEMSLDVKVADYAQIEQLTKQINMVGIQAELGTVSGNKGAYTARMIIKDRQ
jgi:general secretion pathway protein L